MLLIACSGGGNLPFPKDAVGGAPIGTSASDVWWMSCDEEGHLAPFHGSNAIPTTLPCEAVSAAPAGRGALWIAGTSALIRLDASGTEDDHTAEVQVDGAYLPLRVASHEDHAYALVIDDPEGRMFAFDGGAFVPSTAAGVAATPIAVHADGTMWAQATTSGECGVTNGGAWWCGGAPPTGGLRWDGASWHRSSLAFSPEVDHQYSGMRPITGAFASDDIWWLGGLVQGDTLPLRHWDGLGWRIVEVPAPTIGVEYVVPGPSGLVAIGVTNVTGGTDMFGNIVNEYDLASVRWQGDGWSSPRIEGHYQAIAGPIAWAGQLEDGTVVSTAGDSDRRLYPVAITP